MSRMFRPTEAHLSDKRLMAAALAAAATLAGVAVQAAGPIDVDNALAQCVALKPSAQTTVDQQLMAQVQLNVMKPIGECGCKSAIATYTSEVVLEGGHRSFLQQGAVLVKSSATQTWTLASSVQLVGDRELVLALACAGPD